MDWQRADARPLLLACVNVGGLALSRVVARGGELALRTALGASRLRLARQLVLEILAVAGVGKILGIGVAWVAVKPMASALPFGGLQPTLNITPDARVLFVMALAGLRTSFWRASSPCGWGRAARRSSSTAIAPQFRDLEIVGVVGDALRRPLSSVSPSPFNEQIRCCETPECGSPWWVAGICATAARRSVAASRVARLEN